METERELLDAIRSGDREALKRLFDRFSGYAMATGLRYIPNREEMRDVLQDSFVKILSSIDQFDYRGEGTLRKWVARIVTNKAIDYLREHQRICYVDTIPDEPEEEVVDVIDIPPDILMEMIGQLPDNYRVVLNLYVFRQLSHKEIALQLGIKESTSASLYFRARKMLSRIIKDYLNKQET